MPVTKEKQDSFLPLSFGEIVCFRLLMMLIFIIFLAKINNLGVSYFSITTEKKKHLVPNS
jgi:hypothetical protein